MLYGHPDRTDTVEADFAYAHAYADMANEYLQHESEIGHTKPDICRKGRHQRPHTPAQRPLTRRGAVEGMVRQTTYWLIDDDRILGTSRLRPN